MISAEEKMLIDLEHREERRKMFDEHREESDELYAKKDYEKAVKWAIILLASGVFIAVANTVTDGLVKKALEYSQHDKSN